ncbi:MAG: hypothetical protein RL470_572 [Actinomycetota bacterium]
MTGTLNLVGFGLSAIGPAIATGMIFAAYINGVARQPEARSVLQPIAFLHSFSNYKKISRGKNALIKFA